MSSTGTLEAGTLVGDRYHIEESLGGEGSGAAYRATDLRLERAVALRALAPSEGAQHGKAAARLVHPNVARVLDFGADPALGMEFVVADLGTGGSLAALLAQRGTPPLPLATRIVQEAAAGMAAAHRAGLVHGDLHPGVLWLSRDEGRLRVQVLGLGLTPAGAAPSRSTARYAAPERLRRARELVPAADVFSLGVVAFEVFAGLPAEWTSLLLSMARGQAAIAPSLRDARPELPAHVAQAVRRALLADAAQRWPDAGELAAHLIAESAAAPAHSASAVAADHPVPVVVSTVAEAAPVVAAEPEPVAAEIVAPVDAEPADAAPQPIAEIAPPAEPEPVVEPAVAAVADEPAPAAAEPAVETPAPGRTSRPAPRRAKPIAAAKTDLADSLYIPPTLAKPAPAARAESAAEPAAPPVAAPPEPAPERAPVPVQVAAPPVVSAPEPTVPADETLAAPVLAPVVALVPATPAALPVAAEPVEVGVIAITERRRGGGLAKLGQSSGGNRRGLLAASIAVAVVVGGGVIARTVLAGSDAPAPAAQALAAAALAPGAGAQGTAQPQQASAEAVPAAAAPVPADETPEEQARRLEEERKLEEQRRLQQRQRDSLRNAQQLAAQQQPVPQQVALAAAPRPAASAPAPQIEQRVPAAATAPAETAAPPPAAAPRVDPSRVYGGGEVDQPPSLANGSSFRSAVNRTYPATLRNSGQWGNALVSFTVGADGRVERSSISVDQVSHPAFRAAATAAISSARFNPARVGGQPVRAQVSMPITWQGGGQEDED